MHFPVMFPSSLCQLKQTSGQFIKCDTIKALIILNLVSMSKTHENRDNVHS